MILVMRVDQGPAHVPSRVVQCSSCGADCWLSRYSGPSTIALAAAAGDASFCCTQCLDVFAQLLGGDAP